MTRKGGWWNDVTWAMIGAFPVFFIAEDSFSAVFFGASVLCAISCFEFIFSFLKPFWPRPFNFVLMALVLSSILSGIGLVLETRSETLASRFPLLLASAVLLEYGMLTNGPPAFRRKFFVWTSFFWLILAVGVVHELLAPFELVSALPLWMTGFLFAGISLIRKRSG